MPQALESIFTIPPIETGGVAGRRGYLYQDHVAASFCIQMLTGTADFTEVWCETHDDIALIVPGDSTGQPHAEFVQVKSGQLTKVWTIADLCRRSEKKSLSILERSLAHDRSNAEPRFRMVTRSGVASELEFLTLPLFSTARTADKIGELGVKCKKRLDPFRSPNGNDASFWVANCLWEWNGDLAQLTSRSREVLQEFLESLHGGPLLVRHVRYVHEKIIDIVQAAAAADWNVDPMAKKIKKADLQAQIQAALHEALGLASLGAGEALKRKMESASLSEVTIQGAQDQRINYLRELYTPKYLSTSDHRLIDAEVLATLQNLRSQLESGASQENGQQFHSRCLEAVNALRTSLPFSVPQFVLQGSMYNITDRCRHLFAP